MTVEEKHLLAGEKQRQRSWGKQQRSALTAQQRRAGSAELCRRLLGLSDFRSARTVMSYASFGSEASVDALLSLAPEKRFFHPLCLPERQMTALRPLDEEGWTTGDFGIRCPVPERSEAIDPEELDLVLVPLVAFDRQCRRMGMGGGYYDRFLPRCTRAVKLGVAFSCQEAERIVTGPHDMSLDGVMTELGFIPSPQR